MTQRALLGLIAIFVLVAGCQSVLAPSPNLYTMDGAGTDPFGDVPPALQTSDVDLLYVTDRAPEYGADDNVRYGSDRSMSMAFGSLTVEIGRNLTWRDLVEASRTSRRKADLPLQIIATEERGRFPGTPAPLELIDGVVQPTPEYTAERQDAINAFHAELRRRLAHTPHKSVLIFVHGFNNTMEDAAFRLAELWHFAGREGVPLLYSWPAGNPGLIRGYTHDRESSEFTIFHFKETLRALATCPEVEEVNIVAHSRGTDVVSTSIRELCMVAIAVGRDPQESYKINHVIYAAPDLDLEVTMQRTGAEQTYRISNDSTIYVTAKDRALGSAEWLLASPNRLGKLRPENMDARTRQRLEASRTNTVVDCRVTTGFLGHSYFIDNPATLSDLILVLRYDRRPGADDGRPLTAVLPNWFILDDAYPAKAAPLPRSMQAEREGDQSSAPEDPTHIMFP